MITLEKPKSIARWLALLRLYYAAFPPSERKPVSMILKMYRSHKSDIWCAVEDGRFAGLAITINSKDVILIDYLAVEEKARSRGIGTHMLDLLRETYCGKGLFVEIESTYADVPDKVQRQHRKGFYLRWGMMPMGVMIMLFGVEMELLGYQCRLSYTDYHAFYRDNYNTWAASHITEAVHPETQSEI